jgi:uncharacterized protein YhfF
MTSPVDLWVDYVAAHRQFADDIPVIEPFGDSPELADELLNLVVQGPKRATAGAAHWGVPSVGDHWVVTDGTGVPRVILRVTEVRVGRLDSVDEQFAWDEGEGDRSRDYWLRVHRSFLQRTEGGVADVDALETCFERFVVVWPPEVADA